VLLPRDLGRRYLAIPGKFRVFDDPGSAAHRHVLRCARETREQIGSMPGTRSETT
jgi:hypothetical protein